MRDALNFLEQCLEIDCDRAFAFSQLHAYPAVPKTFFDVIVVYLCLEANVLLDNDQRRSADDCLLVVRLQDNVAVERKAKRVTALVGVYREVSVRLRLRWVRDTRSLLVRRTEVNPLLLDEARRRVCWKEASTVAALHVLAGFNDYILKRVAH